MVYSQFSSFKDLASQILEIKNSLVYFNLIIYIIVQRIVRQMEHKQKILQFYSTGRYECDYDFHIFLLQAIKELNLYEWQVRLQDMTQHVKKIRDLTLLNSKNSDQDYEDQEVISQTYKIKSMVSNICTKDIHAIIKECQELNWESYYAKIHKFMAGKATYNPILQRIEKTIHSQQFRIDSMLFTTLFEMVNGESVNSYIEVYSTIVQIFLKYLTGCKGDVDLISESSVYSNVCQLAKVKHFICTIYLILRVCLRFCEIVKILAGKNNLSLKFTVIKKELQKLIKKHPQWNIIDEKDDIFAILPIIKNYLKNKTPFDKSKICKWCFKTLTHEKTEHEFCRTLIQKRNTFLKS